MAKISLKTKDGIVAEYDLTKLPAKITIGSDPFDIIYIYDETIAKRHLQIDLVGGLFIAENPHRIQDTLINGKLLDKNIELHDGDEISFGHYILVIRDIEKPNTAKAADQFAFPQNEKRSNVEVDSDVTQKENRIVAEDHVVTTGDETIVQDERALNSLQTSAEMAPTRVLQILPPDYDLLVIQGPYAGKKFRLKPDSTRIGRDPNNNDIVIRETKQGEIDHAISRRHATISVKNGCYYIIDNNSKNGTYLNNERLRENDERLLKDEDEIELVSDQESTIFRFAPAGQQKFSPPKIAARKRISNSRQNLIAMAISIMWIVIGLILSIIFYNQRSENSREPGVLKITPRQFKASEVFNDVQKRSARFSNLKLPMPTPVLVDLKRNRGLALILSGPDGNLAAWSFAENRLIWTIADEPIAETDFSITQSDLNSDGSPEILISGRDSRVYAYDCQSGRQVWKSEFLGGKLSSQPSVGDLNGDGLKDIVVCSEDGYLYYGFGSTQKIVWKRIKFEDKTKAIPVVTDIDADGSDEILIGTESGVVRLWVLKDNAIQLKKSYDIKDASIAFIGNSINNAMAAGRLSAGRPEPVLMITTRQYGVIAIDPTNFEHLWSDRLTNPYRSEPVYHCSPLLGDVNADGRLDAVVASHNGEIILYSDIGNSKIDKTHRIAWIFPSQPGRAFMATPALVDLNEDGILDIIAPDTTGKLYILNGLNGLKLHEPIKSNESFSASLLVGDVDGDSFLDIVVVDNVFNINLYQTTTKIDQNAILWSQYAGSASHSCSVISQPMNMFNYNLKLYLSVIITLAALGYLIFIILRTRK